MAAPGAAAAPADLDADRRQQGIDRIRRRARSADHPRARPLARPARRHHPLLRAVPRTRRPPHHPRPSLARHHRLCRRSSKAEAVRETGPHHPLFQPHPVQPRQLHRNQPPARDRLFERRVDRLCASGKPARRGQSRPRGFPQPDDGRVERQAEEMPMGHGRGSRPSGSSTPPTAPAPTRCRSASIAGRCRTSCSSSRSAASPRECCRCCRPTAWPASRWRKRLPPRLGFA